VFHNHETNPTFLYSPLPSSRPVDPFTIRCRLQHPSDSTRTEHSPQKFAWLPSRANLKMPSNSRISSACNGCRTKKQKVRRPSSKIQILGACRFYLQEGVLHPPILYPAPDTLRWQFLPYITVLTHIHNEQCSGDRSVTPEMSYTSLMSKPQAHLGIHCLNEFLTLTER
jgi:hypothetical protein